MTRRRHDSLSKDLLSLWLAPLGRVESPRRVHGEERQIDVVVGAVPDALVARAYRRHLGLLGRMARGVAALEPFRNPCTRRELRNCVVKVVELEEESWRRARRRKTGAEAIAPPYLWVVTPTLSDDLLGHAGARQRSDFPAGFFELAAIWNTTVVVTSLLPATPETLWLRLLGRGEVQRQALDELNGLPSDHPLRAPTARRVLRWRREAELQPNPTEADRELIMNSERWVIQWEKRLLREGKAEGLRVAISDLCELLGIALTSSQRTHLKTMRVGELEALRQAIKQTKRWPPPSPAATRPRAR